MNVISMGQRDQLRLVFEALDAHKGVRVIVLRSVGEHFSSGGDIKGFSKRRRSTFRSWPGTSRRPARCEKPVIVANRGYTFGVGFERVPGCDFRIASQTTRYALPEQNLGQIPGSGGSARLQKIIGITRTKQHGDARQNASRRPGLCLGIATEVVPDSELESTVDALVDELRRFSPLAQRNGEKTDQRQRRCAADRRDRNGRSLLQPPA
ncbi:enoyl-CoA hydratase/isomerase family protein [Pseudomonas umsongensis]|uniref:enoyl-CoA hydratase/isomerase family protein n=1 Tax=Pseudomonas umsongensis TaxID=198618 RepID=UPI0012449D90|nr:enoyl-CoA hydratase/isomerase family protein [Pseudomonas umsongensis]QFG29054.1 enoyl-CoA hydratase/isomerase family protein [Pseudomonas umsongensis]